MANLLDVYKTDVQGSNDQISDYTVNISASGDFKKVKGIETILLSWSNILMTPLGSADWDPTYGSEIYKMLWRPADETTLTDIEEEIQYRLYSFDDRASIENIDVKFLRNKKGFDVSIYVNYEGEIKSLALTMREQDYLDFLQTP